MRDGAAFIEGLRATLPRHANVLAALVAGVEADERWRWFELGCSVGRGAGDERSDLDVGIGAAALDGDGDRDGNDVGEDGDDVPVDAAVALVRSVGPVVDLLVHRLDRPGPHRRIAAEYASGVQLDLVVLPAADRPGLPPGSIALVDKDGALTTPWDPDVRAAATTGPATLREWAFLAWWALGDAAKYLARGSAFEVADRIAEARRLALQLHAAAQGVDYPLFGLTSILDAPEPVVPMWLEETYGPVEPAPLAEAADATVRLLRDAVTAVELRFGVELDVPLAASVMARLAAARPR